MFTWLRNMRRKRWMQVSTPQSWEAILLRHAAFLWLLPAEEQDQIFKTMKVLLAEKHWEGSRGLKITEEIRVTIAAHASRLTLGLAEKFYDQVATIIIHPDSYSVSTRTPLSSGLFLEGNTYLAGQAWQRGPVILSWKDVLREVHRQEPGHNVVLHEFAHQLDMQNGAADGVPVIESEAGVTQWQQSIDEHYQQLVSACQLGTATVLDSYGATNKAEFFAFATEAFFEVPKVLQQELPQLYATLRSFYRQDPAALTP